MDVEHKLEHLLPHWIEHNEQHAVSYREWAALADGAGLGEVAAGVLKACDAIDEANRSLKASLDLLHKNGS